MRVTMPSQFVEGAAAGATEAVEQIDAHEEVVNQQLADDRHAHDKSAGTVKPLDDEEKKTLADLLRRDRDSKPVASK
ncbi:MAG: hypothetical protein ACKVOX_07910 [Rhizobacter sp.]